MKKIKKKDICIFIVALIFIASKIMPKSVNNLDEMWNFNFVRCMANGLKPYTDFSMITGPLYPFIYSIFLRIFGQEMIVTRILSIIFDSIILFLIYKIMDKIEIKDYIKYLSLIVLAYIMGKYFTFDYNWAVLLVTLIITYIELNKTENTWKKDLVLGILAGLTITLKQTIGIIICLATIGYNILNIRNKEDLKKFLKSAVIRFLGVILVSVIFIITLLKLGCFKDYIDYCILSISTFSNKISYLRLIKNKNLVIRILSIIPIIVYIGLIIIYIKKKEKTPLTLLIYSIATMIFIYPISDECHFVLGITITLIGIAYIINLITLRFNINKKVELFLDNFLLCFIVIMGTIFFILGIKTYKIQNINLELNHFKYLPLSKSNIEQVKEVEEYIKSQEKDVYILDASAAWYMIPIDRYNKNYDMFNNGNIGSKGEEGQIENLKNMENKIILIKKDGLSRNWQNPEKVRKYIKENMTKTGQIGAFDIYE